MTEKTLYKCDICGTEYKRIDDAYACESCHNKPKKIERLYYKPKAMGDHSAYPYKVVITFSDGQQLAYKR